MDIWIDFGKIIGVLSVILYAIYLIIRAFLTKEIEIKKMEIKKKNLETVLMTRLQAYERMTLFLERMAPENLLIRLSNPSLSVQDLHTMLLDEIRNEYYHNLSQQIYMSEEVWSMIKNSKETLIARINEIASTMEPRATSIDFSKKILHHFIENNASPMGEALSALKKEIQLIF